MSTQFDYQFNVASKAPAALRIDPNAPLYASEDGVVASLSNNECVFQVKRSGETHVMTYQVLQALDQTRQFRTLDEHAERVMASLGGLSGQREAIGRVFEGLIQRGVLVSGQAFLDRLADTPARAIAPVRGVFIRACDRPDQLAHLLASLTDYERRFRANRNYVVIDDSASRDAANRHRDLLREFARATGCKLTYVGATESKRLLDKLARAACGGAVPVAPRAWRRRSLAFRRRPRLESRAAAQRRRALRAVRR
jgi:hypothetical protein